MKIFGTVSALIARIGLTISLFATLHPVDSAAAAACTPTFISSVQVKVSGIQHILIDDQCSYVYATNSALNRVEIYSAKNGTLLSSIAVGAKPAGMDTSPDGKILYVANSGDSSVSVIDLARATAVKKYLSFQKVSAGKTGHFP